MKTILVVGATSTIAQACIKQWCQIYDDLELILIARDELKLSDFVADLSIRFPSANVYKITLDFNNLQSIYEAIKIQFERINIDLALIAHGMMYVDENKLNLEEVEQLIHVNCSSLVVSLDAIYKFMVMQKNGKIGVISSVAGDRGRKANFLYGSSKAFVSTYVEGLQHKAALLNENIDISLIKPGPTETNMTRYMIERGKKLANVDDVAKTIICGLDKKKRIIYAPAIWKYIMLIICCIPFFLFKKMDV